MNTHGFRLEADYWNRKLSFYLHDPPDKALRIPGHEDRRSHLLQVLGDLPSPDENAYRMADHIAAGMDRAQLPGYSPDPTKNGAVDFSTAPVLTHPTGEGQPLRLRFGKACDVGAITRKIHEIINTDLGKHPGEGLSDRFRNDPASFAAARFYYVHHVLRRRLAEEEETLGGAWYRIPADTRVPDHSIWQHCSLVSALSTCFDLSASNRASVLVYTITPVQDFIARARKLRDYWTGSLILSWLCFEGIREVMYGLGSDHVLYPSLQGQPMVDRLLSRELGLHWLWQDGAGWGDPKVASFPNKFVCLLPTGQEDSFADKIRTRILGAWIDLGERVIEAIERTIGAKDRCLSKQAIRQMETFWDFRWAACPLLNENTEKTARKLLAESIWEAPSKFREKAKKLPFRPTEEGSLYVLTHALTQTLLSAGKTRRTDQRPEEPGIKCDLHGDLEVLHFEWKSKRDKNPPPSADPFWTKLRESWGAKSDFKATERLSAPALIKRLAYSVLRKSADKDHPLAPFFAGDRPFPSTTEVALSDWLDRVERKGFSEQCPKDWRQKLAQVVHDRDSSAAAGDATPQVNDVPSEELPILDYTIKAMEMAGDPIREGDKYLAILLMDGDRMGRLVNGQTISAKWQTVLHPHVTALLSNPGFDKTYRDFWAGSMSQARLVSPAVHAAISESLGDFSLQTVPRIVGRQRGHLVYAGGDDVCAVLPVSSAIQAAVEIARWYVQGFVLIPPSAQATPTSVSAAWVPDTGRLAVHLGSGTEISISAGILIVHHKKPLSAAIRQAHGVLDNLAKTRGKRNALALEVDRRAGGARRFVTRWEDAPPRELQLSLSLDAANRITVIDQFLALASALGRPKNRGMSRSLAYRLDELKPGLEAMARRCPEELVRFLSNQLERSRVEDDETERTRVAEQLASVIVHKTPGNDALTIETEALPMAAFVGECLARAQTLSGGNTWMR